MAKKCANNNGLSPEKLVSKYPKISCCLDSSSRYPQDERRCRSHAKIQEKRYWFRVVCSALVARVVIR